MATLTLNFADGADNRHRRFPACACYLHSLSSPKRFKWLEVPERERFFDATDP
jgi:hypothetical protein